jgi:hypothetical protein
MNEQDRIDEIIAKAASDYNRPPATPRDEMWTAIQAARSSAAPKLHIVHAAPKRFGTRFAWMGMAAAAVLLVATGVGIGRITSRPAALTVRGNPVRVIANAPSPLPTPSNDETGPAPSTQPSSSASSTASAPQPKARTREEIRNAPRIVGKGGLKPLPGTRLAANAPNSNIYQVATVRHLADAEAMLTSFSVGSRDASTNAQFAVWAKGLLSNTRLLLDSPAGDDPRRAKLLQDLELVLAQIVQLSPNAAAEDRELIQGSIQQGHVMTRLRTAIPAGER